jgi:hypothetical protein
LVERVLCKHEVRSSTLLTSTRQRPRSPSAPDRFLRSFSSPLWLIPRKQERSRRIFDNDIIAEHASMNDQAPKGAWWMVRLSEAMKDAPSCDKPGGAALKL